MGFLCRPVFWVAFCYWHRLSSLLPWLLSTDVPQHAWVIFEVRGHRLTYRRIAEYVAYGGLRLRNVPHEDVVRVGFVIILIISEVVFSIIKTIFIRLLILVLPLLLVTLFVLIVR